MMKNVLLVVSLLLLMLSGYAQPIERLSIAATSEAIGLPFTNYLPYHPGFEVRATFIHKATPKNDHRLNTTLGAYFHRKLETGIYLGAEYQYTQKVFRQHLGVDFPIGLGYLHTFYAGELYEQSDTGDFESVAQFGRPHLYINLGIGLSYLNHPSIQPFIRQELVVVTPFANGIPLIPHSFLKIGVHLKINHHE